MPRTMRVDAPPRAISARPGGVERLLALASSRGASVLCLTSQSRPYLRADGEIHVLEGEAPLAAADVEAAVLELTPEGAREALRRGEPTEWVSEFEGIGRIRCTTFRDYRGAGRVLPSHFGAAELGRAAGAGAEHSGAGHRIGRPRHRRRPARWRQVDARLRFRRSDQSAALRVRRHARAADPDRARQPPLAHQPARSPRERRPTSSAPPARRCAKTRMCWSSRTPARPR